MIKFTLNKIVEIILTVLSTKEFYFLDCMKKFLCIYSPHPILKLLKAKFSIFTCITHQVSHTNLFHSPHTFDICSSEKSQSRKYHFPTIFFCLNRTLLTPLQWFEFIFNAERFSKLLNFKFFVKTSSNQINIIILYIYINFSHRFDIGLFVKHTGLVC